MSEYGLKIKSMPELKEYIKASVRSDDPTWSDVDAINGQIMYEIGRLWDAGAITSKMYEHFPGADVSTELQHELFRTQARKAPKNPNIHLGFENMERDEGRKTCSQCHKRL
jgi:hypothetical protein